MNPYRPRRSARTFWDHVETLLARSGVLVALAVVVPIIVGLLLTMGRGHLGAADNALILVVVTVAVASAGNRWAAPIAALVSAGSFDFFLTKPYESFRISSGADTTTEILFVVVGLIVGELAALGRKYRTAAFEGSSGLARVHHLAEQIANGEDPDFVLIAVATELQQLLSLADCRFVREPPSGRGARIESDGTVRLNPLVWPSSLVGLPTHQVELPVRSAGRVFGTFLMTPTPAVPISHDRCLVAVALADQLGQVMSTRTDEDI
jgi:K+-sensing histidine kinase KdpD